jgi:hypothetical protein
LIQSIFKLKERVQKDIRSRKIGTNTETLKGQVIMSRASGNNVKIS